MQSIIGFFLDQRLLPIYWSIIWIQPSLRCWMSPVAFILILLEFQSEVDPWMVLRIDVYTGLLYQQLVDERQWRVTDGLPPVLPIVIYNGESVWSAPVAMRDLIHLPPESPLWKYQPQMRYHVLEEVRSSIKKSDSLDSLLAIFFRMGHPLQPETLIEASRELVGWFQAHPASNDLKPLFRELLVAGLHKRSGIETTMPIPEELEEVVVMLERYVEKWAQEIEQRGIQAGIAIGEQRAAQQGEQKGRAALLLRQLRHRFGTLPESIESTVLSADIAQLEEWSDRVLDASLLCEVIPQ